ncbi:MAG: hypothetical protein ACI9HY_003122 [Planctomycetaceae bacterium]|jgi:hypothetical protein
MEQVAKQKLKQEPQIVQTRTTILAGMSQVISSVDGKTRFINSTLHKEHLINSITKVELLEDKQKLLPHLRLLQEQGKRVDWHAQAQ